MYYNRLNLKSSGGKGYRSFQVPTVSGATAPGTEFGRAQTFALKRIFGRLEVALELTQEDEESLKAVRRLQQIVLDVVGGSSSSGDERPASPFPFPLPGLLPVLTGAGSERDGGVATMGPREAVDAAWKAAAIAGLIGPGLVSISQKFLVQLAVRWALNLGISSANALFPLRISIFREVAESSAVRQRNPQRPKLSDGPPVCESRFWFSKRLATTISSRPCDRRHGCSVAWSFAPGESVATRVVRGAWDK